MGGFVLWCGRHLLHTRYQERLLRSVLGTTVQSLRLAHRLVEPPAGAAIDGKTRLGELIIAITSANQAAFSRYNPVPFHVRAIGADRFANQFADAPHKIVAVQHWPPLDAARFCRHLLSAVREDSESAVELLPANTVVICSQPDVIAGWLDLGFAVVDAELRDHEKTPHLVLRDIVAHHNIWRELATNADLHPLTRQLFSEYPAVPTRIERLWKDPILNSNDSLTDNRDYQVYNNAMANDAIIKLKWHDIADHIVDGLIVDEGCADGSLLVLAAAAFPDADFIGIDLAREMLTRCHARLAAGQYGEAFVHFHQRNLIDAIFRDNSVSTTICNSTAHELFSYCDGVATLDRYLGLKFKQLRIGGRLLIRDVIGPNDKHATRIVRLRASDGANDVDELLANKSDRAAAKLQRLSTAARFRIFLSDFVAVQHAAESAPEQVSADESEAVWRMSARLASEFRAHVDYLESWKSEVQEQFAFFSFADWTALLERHGFTVVRPASRAYCSEWLAKNRFANRVTIEGESSDDPMPTNVVLVAEKR
jgi:hypothetical protein